MIFIGRPDAEWKAPVVPGSLLGAFRQSHRERCKLPLLLLGDGGSRLHDSIIRLERRLMDAKRYILRPGRHFATVTPAFKNVGFAQKRRLWHLEGSKLNAKLILRATRIVKQSPATERSCADAEGLISIGS